LNTIPVIYGSGVFRSIARRYKQQFNENSKIPSKWDVLPEMNHNEIASWETNQLSQYYSVLFLQTTNESIEIQQRISYVKKKIRQRTKRIYDINGIGQEKLSWMLSTLLLGDFISIYLAILRRVDPTPVKMIEQLKKEFVSVGTKRRIVKKLQKMM
jgi:glucose/mannose-6-phosphate isomerase